MLLEWSCGSFEWHVMNLVWDDAKELVKEYNKQHDWKCVKEYEKLLIERDFKEEEKRKLKKQAKKTNKEKIKKIEIRYGSKYIYI